MPSRAVDAGLKAEAFRIATADGELADDRLDGAKFPRLEARESNYLIGVQVGLRLRGRDDRVPRR
jgi:hypothetical protein